MWGRACGSWLVWARHGTPARRRRTLPSRLVAAWPSGRSGVARCESGSRSGSVTPGSSWRAAWAASRCHSWTLRATGFRQLRASTNSPSVLSAALEEQAREVVSRSDPRTVGVPTHLRIHGPREIQHTRQHGQIGVAHRAGEQNLEPHGPPRPVKSRFAAGTRQGHASSVGGLRTSGAWKLRLSRPAAVGGATAVICGLRSFTQSYWKKSYHRYWWNTTGIHRPLAGRCRAGIGPPPGSASTREPRAAR